MCPYITHLPLPHMRGMRACASHVPITWHPFVGAGGLHGEYTVKYLLCVCKVKRRRAPISHVSLCLICETRVMSAPLLSTAVHFRSLVTHRLLELMVTSF
jgi:hypothetical protein